MSQIGRSARTGRYTTVKEARKYPSTHVVEHQKPAKRK